METKKIPVGFGKFALVDDTDYDWLNQFMWRVDSQGYVASDWGMSFLCDIPVPDTTTLMSRLILGLEVGDKQEADHINHNILDNRRENLRIASRSQNHGNEKIGSGKTSRFKGVHWEKQSKKWHAQIGLGKKMIHLGLFDNEKHAAHAYNLAARRHFKEYALLNKI